MKYIFIINGRPDKQPHYKELLHQLETFPEEHAVYLTHGVGDATRYTHVYCDLHPNEQVCFVACGGDGTVNEVASGLVGFDNIELAVLNIGSSSNDFCRYYPDYDFTNPELLLKGTTTPIDILKVNDSYSINVCNFGFDSNVVSIAEGLTEEGMDTTKAYKRGIALSILAHRFNRIKITADGEKLGGLLLTNASLSNCRCMANGFICAPYAKNDDGLIEVCILKPCTLLRFLISLKDFVVGKHLEKPFTKRKFIYRQAKHVTLQSNQLFSICLDGELLVGATFDIQILPSAIQLRLPEQK